MKIQQMAFVLVAIIIFFGLVALLYISISSSSTKTDVASLRADAARELVARVSGSPEFYDSQCANCIDLDKLISLKNKTSYEGFWNLDYLAVESIYPSSTSEECTDLNYPNCSRVTLVNNGEIGTPRTAYTSVCRWVGGLDGYKSCTLGVIYASGKGID